jgi:predicted AAA+ superfamily ATPase
MALSNSERIGKGLELLRDGLVPFVEREMKAVYGDKWKEMAKQSISKERDGTVQDGKVQWDAYLVLLILWNNWNNVFKRTLGQAERNYVSELREVRNQWAHQNPFSYDDTYRALDTMTRFLLAVSAPEAEEITKMAQETMRVRFAEQARQEIRRKSVVPVSGSPMAGLKPWREVVTPHPDVATGRYPQAEFAADMEQVRSGRATSEYGDPKEFFRRTYLTIGLTDLLKDAFIRLTNKGGAPVVELQTNFGGGKTHSMLALYHLFSGVPANELAGIEPILQEMGVTKVPQVNRVALVGTALNPGQPHAKPDGTKVKTLWGELAWQLDGKKAYALIGKNDANGTSPGSRELSDIFKRYSPCLILIDEWIAYARQTYGKTDLPGGSFDSNITFAQAISEATRATPGTLLVATIPASDIEIGGEGGKEALTKLHNTFSRMESTWRPASAEESFEIVRRRLFEPITDPVDFAARDAVIRAFGQFYHSSKEEFPQGCGEAEYERRLEKAYPIHPELFDRLYEDWGSLERFQRTRGVLRLMAAVISELWDRQDSSLLILPASVPMDAPTVQSELTRYLEDNWRPVMEKDVDGPEALPLKIDRETPNLGRYSAARRVARTIFMGSAPLARAKSPGIDDRRVRLGCVQPGENTPTFGDALRRLTDQATHLYVDGKRFWFSTQPSVTRLAQDRAAQQIIDDVWVELKRRLRADRQRGDFVGVHQVPETSGDVPDEMEVRLVILGPETPHVSKAKDSPARIAAEEILSKRGNSPRLYRNMLVFLAPDRARLNDLEQAIRQYLAWKSICDERESLNLDAFQSNQAETKRGHADETVTSRIMETYCWALIPTQPNPQEPMEWQESRLQGQDALAIKASRKLKNDGIFMTQFSPTNLRLELDRFLWKDVDHLGLKKLWEYFATYLYLPRLKDSHVLIQSVQEGVQQITWKEYFAYAEGWDEEKKRYLGLRAGQVSSVLLDNRSLIIKPEIVMRQLDTDRAQSQKTQFEGGTVVVEVPGGEVTIQAVEPREARKPRRFYGSVKLDAKRLGRDAGKIAEEVVQHLSTLAGSKVEVSLEINAEIPDGAPDNVVRTVTENCNTLHFTSHGFEES